MFRLFIVGGPVYMAILTILLVALFLSAWKVPKCIKEIGYLALVLGILFQLIDVYAVCRALSQTRNDVDITVLAGGLKVSLIAPIYGMAIYALSRVLRLFCKPVKNI